MINSKKAIIIGKILQPVVYLLIGGFFGFFIVDLKRNVFHDFNIFFLVAASLLAFVLLFLIHIITHEAGHLVCGLISGYKFSSFRILSFSFVKTDGKIKLKRLSLAGTGGQCLLIPPDLKDGKYPFKLYLFGGSFFNMILGTISLITALLFADNAILFSISVLSTAIGFGLAFLNFFPIHAGAVYNDGMNFLICSRDPKSADYLWRQLKISSLVYEGTLLSQMPLEWFEVDESAIKDNSLASQIVIFKFSLFLEKMDFESAKKLAEKLVLGDYGLIELQDFLLRCELIFFELISENNQTAVQSFKNKPFDKYFNSMANFPSVLRLQYTMNLLCDKDKEKADKTLKQFKKIAKSYPLKYDTDLERKIIQYVDSLIT